jgi:hypothetical protein
MTNPVTKRRVNVWPDFEVGPWIIVPVSGLSQVQALLDENQVRYTLSELIITIDKNPPTRKINLARGTAPDAVQQLLDRLP